ncbi:AAA family ATPase [Cylindrospermopsis raciborskii DSH]
MTGVTKFSKVSLFSGINQLTDITIDSNTHPSGYLKPTCGSPSVTTLRE